MTRPAEEGDVTEDADYQFVPFDKERVPVASQRLGELHLSGQVQLFPADGQHRSRWPRVSWMLILVSLWKRFLWSAFRFRTTTRRVSCSRIST